MKTAFKMKLWGWGQDGTRFDIENRPKLLPYLHKYMAISSLDTPNMINGEKITIPACAMPATLLETFSQKLGEENVSTVRTDRIVHSVGKAYPDFIKVRQTHMDEVVDVVLYPKNEGDILSILKIAQESKIAIIPFGGGSSVASGLTPKKGKNLYTASVDLCLLNKILALDKVSLLANIEAGMFGPALEKELNAQGYTLGHFPQSFEFSTLGGWLATRSSGQNSLFYGGIEKIATSIRMITFDGPIETLAVPRMAGGPDLKELIVGSEGRFGIITSAWMKIHPLPEKQQYHMYFFKSFSDAELACKEIVQTGAKLAMLRVSDEHETEAMLSMSRRHDGLLTSLLSSIIKLLLKFKGFNSSFCSIMVGHEGNSSKICRERQLVKKMFRPYTHLSLGTAAGSKWLQDRFFLPYN